MASETSYVIQVGFIQSDIFFTIILFIYLTVKPQSPHSRTSTLLCSVTTLCTASLTPLSFLTVSVSIPIHFLSLFCLGWKVCLLGCSPSSAADWLSCSKISVSNPSYLSPKVPRMEVDTETYDGRSQTAHNLGQHLLYQQCSATTVNRKFSAPAANQTPVPHSSHYTN